MNVVTRAGGQGSEECIIVLDSLYNNLHLILQQFDSQILQDTDNCIVPPTIHSATAGRPWYDLTADQINHCLELGYNWQGISALFGIDQRTLFRHRQRLSIPSNEYSSLPDENLTLIIRQAICRRIYSVGGPNELWYVIN